MKEEDYEVECPVCGCVRPHILVHAKRGVGREGMEFTLKCTECGSTHKRVFSEEKLVDRPYVLSEGGVSTKGTTKLFSDESVSVGEELYLGDRRCVVTALETKNGRAESARSTDITTIWARSTSVKVVRISVNQGSRTLSLKVEAQPEEEFAIGDIVETDKGRVVITGIRTDGRSLDRGSVEAADIVRVYAKMVREGQAHHPRPGPGGAGRRG